MGQRCPRIHFKLPNFCQGLYWENELQTVHGGLYVRSDMHSGVHTHTIIGGSPWALPALLPSFPAGVHTLAPGIAGQIKQQCA